MTKGGTVPIGAYDSHTPPVAAAVSAPSASKVDSIHWNACAVSLMVLYSPYGFDSRRLGKGAFALCPPPGLSNGLHASRQCIFCAVSLIWPPLSVWLQWLDMPLQSLAVLPRRLARRMAAPAYSAYRSSGRGHIQRPPHNTPSVHYRVAPLLAMPSPRRYRCFRRMS